MLDKSLLDLLVCPVSGGALRYDSKKQLLICEKSGLAYPVRDGIPALLEEESQPYKSSNKTQSKTAASTITKATKTVRKPKVGAANTAAKK